MISRGVRKKIAEASQSSDDWQSRASSQAGRHEWCELRSGFDREKRDCLKVARLVWCLRKISICRRGNGLEGAGDRSERAKRANLKVKVKVREKYLPESAELVAKNR